MFKKSLLTATITWSVLLSSCVATAAQGPAFLKANTRQLSDKIAVPAIRSIEKLIMEVAAANGISIEAFIRMAQLKRVAFNLVHILQL